MNEPTQYAAGWGTLSLINAGLAQSKGRSGLAWWLISVFLGPIATFLIVILDPVKKPTKRVSQANPVCHRQHGERISEHHAGGHRRWRAESSAYAFGKGDVSCM